MFGWIILALAAIAVIAVVSFYNTLVRRRNDVDNAFAQIDVQLTRRYELIPNLVEVAKKYLQHEQETLTRVTAARNQAASALHEAGRNPEALPQLARAEQALNTQLGGLYATFEAYPELKADQQMRDLQEEISSTENRVAFARQHFNDSVTEYNNTAQQFPNNIIAALFGFKVREWLEIDDITEKRQPVKVNFG
ncbi:MAG: LemA family protein [Cardiobacteriaceae bacterium]|nr:LemA family protein [Cardiobacteriaceae bacterium]